MSIGVAKTVAVKHDLGAKRADGVRFNARRRRGHDDHRFAAKTLGGQGDALGMVARGGGDYAAGESGLGQMGHFVVGAP